MHSISKRQQLLEALQDYASRYSNELEVINRVIDLIHREPDCAQRNCFPGHLTGSGWLVDPSGSRVLLTHHAKLDMWLQLGGHADGDLALEKVAEREVVEESGLENFKRQPEGIFDIDIHRIPERGREPEHFHYDIRYSFRMLDADSQYQVSDESHDLQWVDLHTLEHYTREPSMLRMRDKWKDAVEK